MGSSRNWSRRRTKKKTNRKTNRKAKQEPLSPASIEVMRLRAEVSKLMTDDEIDAAYRTNPGIQETIIDWFHAVHAHARAERLPNIQQYCQLAWQATWRFPLSDARYRYLAFMPAHAKRRAEAYERLVREQAYDPGMSTLAILNVVLQSALDFVRAVLADGDGRLQDINGVTVVKVRDENGQWIDLAIPHKQVPPAATAAFKLMAVVLQQRMALECLERGYVLGARSKIVRADQRAHSPVGCQQVQQPRSDGYINASDIPKATPFAVADTPRSESASQVRPEVAASAAAELAQLRARPDAPAAVLSKPLCTRPEDAADRSSRSQSGGAA